MGQFNEHLFVTTPVKQCYWGSHCLYKTMFISDRGPFINRVNLNQQWNMSWMIIYVHVNFYLQLFTHARQNGFFNIPVFKYGYVITYHNAVWMNNYLQYIPRNMHTVFAMLCFVVVIHWLIFPYPSGLLHWHCGNLTIAPVPAKQPWWIWINTSCEFIMNDCITTTKQSTTKPCAYFLGYTVHITTDAMCIETLLK